MEQQKIDPEYKNTNIKLFTPNKRSYNQIEYQQDNQYSQAQSQFLLQHPQTPIKSPAKNLKLPLIQLNRPNLDLKQLQVNLGSISNHFSVNKVLAQTTKASFSPNRIIEHPKSNQDYQSPSTLKISPLVYPQDLSPEPILSKYQKIQNEPDHRWNKRFLGNNNLTANALFQSQDLEASTPQQKKERESQLNFVQDQLKHNQHKIRIKQDIPIQTDLYPKFFKYKIYECYKPSNLSEARNYLRLLTDISGQSKPDTSMQTYLKQEQKTLLPNFVDQKKLLQFLSNFESGNLDSAYLVNETHYNLLLKVDTNTRGGTHWFYFKVVNWRAGQTVKFSILNFVRNLQDFYSNGMNVYIRSESLSGTSKSDWRISNEIIKNISFMSQNSIVRKFDTREDPPKPKSYYGSLNFECTFPSNIEVADPMQNSQNVFCFAYALPYGFTDLQQDLKFAQKTLLDTGGIYNIQQQLNSIELKREKEEAPLQIQQRIAAFQDQLNSNQNLTKQEKFLLNRQQDEELKDQTKLISQVRDNSVIDIQTDLLIFRQEVISQTVGGLNVYQLTLTLKQLEGFPLVKKRKVIYMQARQHAAETPGSWVIKNLIHLLVSKPQEHKELLGNFVLKFIPMINVDGTVLGNSRSSIFGVDLNRRWREPNSILHPEIHFLKSAMSDQAQSEQGIHIFCDLHGHNRKQNCFFFGCSKASDEGMVSWTKTRLLPKLFAKNEPIFDYNSCRFSEEKTKQTTARVVVWGEMKITNSLTLEISMFGKDSHQNFDLGSSEPQLNQEFQKSGVQFVQFKCSDFEQIAQSFLVSIVQFSRLEKQLENIWLKPSLLKQITGVAARDRKISLEEAPSNEKDLNPVSQKPQIKQGTFVIKKNSSFKIKDVSSKDGVLINLKNKNEITIEPTINNQIDEQTRKPRKLVGKFNTSDQLTNNEDLSDMQICVKLNVQSNLQGDEYEEDQILELFSNNELNDARQKLKLNQKKSVQNFDSDLEDSDSQPSEDNLDSSEMDLFVQTAIKIEIKAKGQDIKQKQTVARRPTRNNLLNQQATDQSKSEQKQQIKVRKVESFNLGKVDEEGKVRSDKKEETKALELALDKRAEKNQVRIHPVIQMEKKIQRGVSLPDGVPVAYQNDNFAVQLQIRQHGGQAQMSFRSSVNQQSVQNQMPNFSQIQAKIDSQNFQSVLTKQTLSPKSNQEYLINTRNRTSRNNGKRKNYATQGNTLEQLSSDQIALTQVQTMETKQIRKIKIVQKNPSSSTTVNEFGDEQLSPISKLQPRPTIDFGMMGQQTQIQPQNDYNSPKNYPGVVFERKQLSNQGLDTSKISGSLPLSPKSSDHKSNYGNQNVQVISNSIIINYFSPQSPKLSKQQATKQPKQQQNESTFMPPFKVYSIQKPKNSQNSLETFSEKLAYALQQQDARLLLNEQSQNLSTEKKQEQSLVLPTSEFQRDQLRNLEKSRFLVSPPRQDQFSMAQQQRKKKQ